MDRCHAFAITVNGADGSADCGTFIPLPRKGGLGRAALTRCRGWPLFSG
jgi:hypothetical protein